MSIAITSEGHCPPFKNKVKEYILGKCKLCNIKEIGNNYHYLLVCPEFKIPRMEHIRKCYHSQPNKNKFTQLLNTQNYSEILHLEKFKAIIQKRVSLVQSD